MPAEDNGILQSLLWLCYNCELTYLSQIYLPSEIRSEVASRLSQKETHERTTKRTQGPYTVIMKLPMWRCKWKLASRVENSPAAHITHNHGFGCLVVATVRSPEDTPSTSCCQSVVGVAIIVSRTSSSGTLCVIIVFIDLFIHFFIILGSGSISGGFQ